ncbi:MAG TPA: aspartate kinase [Bacteroidales bacterium]|nr:aspartate kinase [Bacteroidales bacterium]
MKVLKFGGTSVGNADRLRKVCKLLNGDEPIVVVLSAMAGVTNSLVEITELVKSGKMLQAIEKTKELEDKHIKTAEELFDSKMYRKRGEEFISNLFLRILSKLIDGYNQSDSRNIVALGEQLSAGLFHIQLTEQGKRTAYIPALEYMRIDKDGEPDFFYIEQNLKRLLHTNPFANIYVTEGFICLDTNGLVNNLGRGGSDFTAAIIGNVLNANEVQIWTDIDGVHNNDPRYVTNTCPLRQLSYDEAAELAYFGAKILHPQTVHPCKAKDIPVVLKNTLNPADEGTVISSVKNRKRIKAVAAKDGITAINIKSSRMLLAYGFLHKVFEVFNTYKTPVDMITTSEVSISLTIDNTINLENIVNAISQFAHVEVERNQTIVCLVGDFPASHKGYTAMVFDCLREIPIRMISYGGSVNNISFLIDSHYKVQALRLLQQLFPAVSVSNSTQQSIEANIF